MVSDSDKCDYVVAYKTVRYVLQECRRYLSAAERSKVLGRVICHENMLTTPRYASTCGSKFHEEYWVY